MSTWARIRGGSPDPTRTSRGSGAFLASLPPLPHASPIPPPRRGRPGGARGCPDVAGSERALAVQPGPARRAALRQPRRRHRRGAGGLVSVPHARPRERQFDSRPSHALRGGRRRGRARGPRPTQRHGGVPQRRVHLGPPHRGHDRAAEPDRRRPPRLQPVPTRLPRCARLRQAVRDRQVGAGVGRIRERSPSALGARLDGRRGLGDAQRALQLQLEGAAPREHALAARSELGHAVGVQLPRRARHPRPPVLRAPDDGRGEPRLRPPDDGRRAVDLQLGRRLAHDQRRR